MMKKFLAILLAMMLVLVNVAALADDPAPTTEATEKVTPTEPYKVTIPKVYEVIKIDDKVYLPKDETLKFTATLTGVTNSTVDFATADAALKAPIVIEYPIAKTEAAGDVTFEKDKAITFMLPSYPAVGIYSYTFNETSIKSEAGEEEGATVETANRPAGVTYVNPNLFMKVIVTDLNGVLQVASVTFRTAADPNNEKTTDDGEKVFQVTNEYAAGNLTIKKSVTGNFGDKTLPFEMTVTFTSEDPVYSDLTINLTNDAAVTKIDGTASTATTIEGDGWKSKSVTFELKNADEIKFENVPATVKYEVTETKAGADGYTTKITGSDNDAVEKATAASKMAGEIVVNPAGEGEGAKKTITPDEVIFTNDKSITPDTGIELETLPFVLLMGIALVGVMALRRREDY